MSIDDITQTAGVAKGTFYTYFRRREDIISVIAYEDFDKSLEGISDDSMDVSDRIAHFLNASVRIIESNSLQIAQQWYRSVTSPLDGDTLGMDKINYDRNFIENCLKCAVDNGTLKENTPVTSLALQIVSVYYGAVVLWCMSDGKISQSELVNDFCRDGLSGIIDKYRAENKGGVLIWK